MEILWSIIMTQMIGKGWHGMFGIYFLETFEPFVNFEIVKEELFCIRSCYGQLWSFPVVKIICSLFRPKIIKFNFKRKRLILVVVEDNEGDDQSTEVKQEHTFVFRYALI